MFQIPYEILVVLLAGTDRVYHIDGLLVFLLKLCIDVTVNWKDGSYLILVIYSLLLFWIIYLCVIPAFRHLPLCIHLLNKLFLIILFPSFQQFQKFFDLHLVHHSFSIAVVISDISIKKSSKPIRRDHWLNKIII